MTSGGDGGMTSSSEELSKKMKGIPKSPKHRQKMMKAAQRYWATASDERRQIVIDKNKSEAGKKSSADAQHRRWSDPSQRKAMSERLKGKPKSLTHRENLSKSLIGKRHSDEARTSMSNAQKERWTPELRKEKSDQMTDKKRGVYKTKASNKAQDKH